jgi:DNA-binding transcriptional LysR family regulator
MSRLPDFEGLAIFAKVLQMQSFSRAAAELQLSKATVSKAVNRLETRFGTRLFNRSARRLSLTEAGKQLAERAMQILADGEMVESIAISGAIEPRGHIRLAAPLSFGVLEVAPILPEFLNRYPDISIDLHLSDAQVDLIGEGYDAAVRIAALPDSSLVARTIVAVPRYLVAAPDYIAKYGQPDHPSQLTEHRCVGYASSVADTWRFHANGQTATVQPRGPLRVNNGDAMMPLLLAGGGLGILPEFIMRDALRAGRLVVVLPDWAVGGGAVHWVTPSGGQRPRRVDLLGDFLTDKLSSRGARPAAD